MTKKMSNNFRLGRIVAIFGIASIVLNPRVEAKALQIPKEIAIYYLTDWDESDLIRAAYLVKGVKAKESAVFLILGDIFSDPLSTALFNGQAETAIFEQAGVDAVIMTEGLFYLGLKGAKAVIDSADFHFLGSNLKTDSTSQPLTAGYLIKNLGSLRLALLGIVPQPFPLVKRLKGMSFENPDYALKWALPLLGFRSDLILVFGAKTPTAHFSWDFKELGGLPSHTLGRIRLVAKGKKWEEKREAIPLEPSMAEDAGVRETIVLYQQKADAILNTSIADSEISITGLEKAITASTGADFGLLEPDIVSAGAGTTKQILNLLSRKGHLPIFELTGQELKGLKGAKVDPNRVYQVATTMEEADKRSILKDKKFELSDKSLVRMVLDYYRHEAD